MIRILNKIVLKGTKEFCNYHVLIWHRKLDSDQKFIFQKQLLGICSHVVQSIISRHILPLKLLKL